MPDHDRPRYPPFTQAGLARDAGGPDHDPLAEKFWANVARGDGCWLWAGPFDRKGYGRWSHPGLRGPVRAARFAYTVAVGPIPEGMYICHRCDNPPCVRPDHLFAGTAADNAADMTRKGRNAKGLANGAHTKPERRRIGEAHGSAKLTEDQVAAIRSLSGSMPQRDIASMFGVGQATVWRVLSGTGWRHVR